MQQLLASPDGVLPIVNPAGGSQGLVLLEEIREAWNEKDLNEIAVAADVAKAVRSISPAMELQAALDLMEAENTSALPVESEGRVVGVLTRDAVGRFLFEEYLRVGRDRTRSGGAQARPGLPSGAPLQG
jgi:CBS domain-containing protein